MNSYEHYICAFLSYLKIELNRSQSTIDTYGRCLRQYAEFLTTQNFPAGSVKEVKRLLRKYLATRKRNGISDRSIALFLTALSAFQNFLSDTDAPDLYYFRIPKVKYERNEPQIIKLTDFQKLLKRPSKVSNLFVAYRDITMLELLFGTGIRRGELVGITLYDINWEDVSLRVHCGRRMERILPIGSPALESCKLYLPYREQILSENSKRCDYLFINRFGGHLSARSVNRILRKYGDGINTRVTPQVLRHSMATHMIRHGVDSRVLQSLLGDKSLSDIQVYTDLKKKKRS